MMPNVILNKPLKGPIYLMVETIARELDAKVLLAAEALSRNYIVIIGPKIPLLKAAEVVGQGIWLNKAHADKHLQKMFKPLLKAGIFITALDEEGLVFSTPSVYIMNRGIVEGTAFKALKTIFTWGNYQQDILKKVDKYQSNFLAVGNPRIDLLRPEFKEFYQSKINSIKEKYNSYILINTNFALYNVAKFYKTDSIIEKKRKDITSEKHYDYVVSRVKYKKQLFYHFLELVKILSREFSEINLVLRPHPSEEISRWSNLLKEYPNVHVVRDGNVHPWIIASKALIHSGCTTGIEAFIAEKAVFGYHPIYDEEQESELSNSLGIKCEKPEQIIQGLKSLSQSTYKEKDPAQENYLKHYISNYSGDFSYKQIVNEFERICSNKIKYRDLINLKLKESYQKTLKSLIKKLFQNKNKSEKKYLKFPELNEADISSRLNDFYNLNSSKTLLQKTPFTTKIIEKNTIMIIPSNKNV